MDEALSAAWIVFALMWALWSAWPLRRERQRASWKLVAAVWAAGFMLAVLAELRHGI